MAFLNLFRSINIVFKPKDLILFSKACLGHLVAALSFFFSFHSCFTQQVLAVYVAPERVCGKTNHDTPCKPSPLLLMWSRISLLFLVATVPLMADGHLYVQFIYTAARTNTWF